MEKINFIFIAIGALILFRLLFRRNRFSDDYKKLYNEILTSDKYKVKGQYDKE
jgi:hypothetical protein